MLQSFANFIAKNWIDILLIVVGASAFVTYWLQERRKVSEAASLIVLQVEDLQNRIAEIRAYIVEDKLNESAFYESQTLFKTDYWDKHKHYFIKTMDTFSFKTFDDFYKCASDILEQQQLMKNLQKNSFYLTQQMLMQSETQYITQALSISDQSPVNISSLLNTAEENLSSSASSEQRIALENLIKRMTISNQNVDSNTFWNIYGFYKNRLHSVINKNALTNYTPVQIRITLVNALRRYSTIQIIGCEGYRKLKRIAERKF